jgi:hypothetical protein
MPRHTVQLRGGLVVEDVDLVDRQDNSIAANAEVDRLVQPQAELQQHESDRDLDGRHPQAAHAADYPPEPEKIVVTA